MIKSLAALILALAIAGSAANAETATAPEPVPAGTPTAQPTVPPTPVPAATPTGIATASATAAASAAATPPNNLIQYTGQLLDYRNNFVYFTSGDAFPAVDAPRIIDAMTGLPTTIAPRAKMFARATFDPATKKIIELAITPVRLRTSAALGPATAFVVVGSTPVPAPEIGGPKLTGKRVAVTFEITVPPTTNLTDQIYISTDTSDWNPTAIRLDRVDAYRYRAQQFFASGTKFAFRVTRGSWNSVERGEDNLDAPPHQFFVREVDALAARVTVYHWSDERGTSRGVGPDSIPTPFNPSPFAPGFGGGPGGFNPLPQVKAPVTPPPGH